MMPSGIWELGCPCARVLSAAHKGGVKAENMSAGGARVMFWLPMEEDEQMEIKDRVLVIEDDKSIRNFMKTSSGSE